jgi:hypothetical protein
MGRLTLGFFINAITNTIKAEDIIEIIKVNNIPSIAESIICFMIYGKF